jgi:hypothetical protein
MKIKCILREKVVALAEAWDRASITERSVTNDVDSPDSQIKVYHGKLPPFPSQ